MSFLRQQVAWLDLSRYGDGGGTGGLPRRSRSRPPARHACWVVQGAPAARARGCWRGRQARWRAAWRDARSRARQLTSGGRRVGAGQPSASIIVLRRGRWAGGAVADEVAPAGGRYARWRTPATPVVDPGPCAGPCPRPCLPTGPCLRGLPGPAGLQCRLAPTWPRRPRPQSSGEVPGVVAGPLSRRVWWWWPCPRPRRRNRAGDSRTPPRAARAYPAVEAKRVSESEKPPCSCTGPKWSSRTRTRRRRRSMRSAPGTCCRYTSAPL